MYFLFGRCFSSSRGSKMICWPAVLLGMILVFGSGRCRTDVVEMTNNMELILSNIHQIIRSIQFFQTEYSDKIFRQYPADYADYKKCVESMYQAIPKIHFNDKMFGTTGESIEKTLNVLDEIEKHALSVLKIADSFVGLDIDSNPKGPILIENIKDVSKELLQSLSQAKTVLQLTLVTVNPSAGLVEDKEPDEEIVLEDISICHDIFVSRDEIKVESMPGAIRRLNLVPNPTVGFKYILGLLLEKSLKLPIESVDAIRIKIVQLKNFMRPEEYDALSKPLIECLDKLYKKMTSGTLFDKCAGNGFEDIIDRCATVQMLIETTSDKKFDDDLPAEKKLVAYKTAIDVYAPFAYVYSTLMLYDYKYTDKSMSLRNRLPEQFDQLNEVREFIKHLEEMKKIREENINAADSAIKTATAKIHTLHHLQKSTSNEQINLEKKKLNECMTKRNAAKQLKETAEAQELENIENKNGQLKTLFTSWYPTPLNC